MIQVDFVLLFSVAFVSATQFLSFLSRVFAPDFSCQPDFLVNFGASTQYCLGFFEILNVALLLFQPFTCANKTAYLLIAISLSCQLLSELQETCRFSYLEMFSQLLSLISAYVGLKKIPHDCSGISVLRETPSVFRNLSTTSVFYSTFVLNFILLLTTVYFFLDFSGCPSFTEIFSNSLVSEKSLVKMSQCADVVLQRNAVATRIVFFSTYLLLQAFAVPGPLILSILAGSMFSFFEAQLLVGLAATLGACSCYLLSKILGKSLIQVFNCQKQCQELQKKILGKSGSLLFAYLLATRISPVPNIVVNVSSPHLGVPLKIFFLSTAVGLVPFNTCHILSGTALRQAKFQEVDRKIVFSIFFVGSLLLLLLLRRR